MIGPNGKETNCFSHVGSLLLITQLTNPSVLNNASVLWCAKKSRMRVLRTVAIGTSE